MERDTVYIFLFHFELSGIPRHVEFLFEGHISKIEH